MNFETIPGKRAPGDKILLVICPVCRYEEAVLLKDWLKWARFKARVEDNNYPPPHYLGRDKLIAFLRDGLERGDNSDFKYSISEVCKRHNIPGF